MQDVTSTTGCESLEWEFLDRDTYDQDVCLAQYANRELYFGDKYLGIVCRDHGKYGSIPLYDDYGEET